MLLICADAVLSLLQTAIPFTVGYFIDAVVPNREPDLFFIVLACFVALILATLTLTTVRNRLNRIVSEKPGRDLQLQMFGKLRDLGFSYYERHPVGATLSLFSSDVAAMQSLYRDLPKLVQDVLLVAAMLAVMFHADWRLTLAVIPCFALFYTVEPYLSRQAERWGKERSDRLRAKNKQLYDSLVALPEVRAHAADRWNVSNVMDKLDAFHDAELKTRAYSLMRAAVRNLSVTVGALVMFACGSVLMRAGHLEIGQFVACSIVYFMAIGRFTFIFYRISALKVLGFKIEKLYQFMERKPDVREPSEPIRLPVIRGELTFTGVSFRYPERPGALKRIHLHIRAGERIAVVGASGSGKSTLIKLISRLYDPDEGEIRLDGVPLRNLSLAQLREAVGYVFQETFLFGSTIRENIRFARPDATDDEVTAAARAAYAHDFIADCPQGYDTWVGERGVKLSGGQKQRIAIARMFLKNPAIVVLDEATSALDNASEAEVKKALDALLRGKTTIAVAHRLSTIRDYDRIVVIEGGSIVESGTYAELMEKKGQFHRIARAGDEWGEEA